MKKKADTRSIPVATSLGCQDFSAPAQLPCIGVCALDSDGLCYGCLRTADEIDQWHLQSNAWRHAVLRRLALRKSTKGS